MLDFIFLGYVGSQPAEEPYITLSRIASLYYFFYFAVLMHVAAYMDQALTVSYFSSRARS